MVEKVFYNCLSCGIRNEKIKLNDNISNVQLDNLLKRAREHDVLALVYNSLRNTEYIQTQSKEIIERFKKEVLLSNIYQINFKNIVNDTLKNISNTNIELIVLKGFVLRNYYPKPEYRTMGDIDIIAKVNEIDLAKKLLKQNDWIEGVSAKAEVVFTKDIYRLELHWDLISNKELVTNNTFDNNIWRNKIKLNKEYKNIYSLSTDDTLIYIITHMAKHMKYLGFGVRQLCDLTLFIEKENIDWKYVEEKLEENKLIQFTNAIIKVCELLLNLECPKGFRNKDDIEEDIINALINNILNGGVHGKSNRINHISKINGSVFFPKYNIMKEKYEYIKVWKPLIIVAWMQRFINILIRKNYSFNEKLYYVFRHKKIKKQNEWIISSLGI